MRPDKVCETTEKEDDEGAGGRSVDTAQSYNYEDDDAEGNNVTCCPHGWSMIMIKILA